ncbi:nucleotidyl transferase AbiEii/AbiGii toxin family protein [Pauljensenia sp. 20925_1_25]|uniref:nucleotidyl transferase AbiEii/AbiGii toxin family protein n=1 Tax=Pauljensenia sp. 20925_1_25 TaxID=3003692 RepID=UPI00352ECB49
MAHSVQETQRQLIACALEVLADAGFALAGSGAIREHGMTQRPTNDINLFTVMQASTRFPHAVNSLIEHLTANDYDVTIERVSPSFAQLSVTPLHGVPLSVDLAIDWRAHTPVRLDVGPVLDIEDAVGNKLSALYSRSYPRDYLDVDAIRSTGTISDARLIELLQERDAGFFTECLRGAHSISLTQVAAYGINASQLHTIQQRFHAWADDIDNQCNE